MKPQWLQQSINTIQLVSLYKIVKHKNNASNIKFRKLTSKDESLKNFA